MAQAGFSRGRGAETATDLLVLFGPTLKVDVGLKSQDRVGAGPPNLPEKGVKALIDTGAGGDCIDDDLARALGLPVIDEGEISGVGGRHDAKVYLARIFIPSMGKLLFQSFTGVKLSEGGQWHRVILGRTFLRHCRLTYDGGSGAVAVDAV